MKMLILGIITAHVPYFVPGILSLKCDLISIRVKYWFVKYLKMKIVKVFSLLFVVLVTISCSRNNLEPKGFSVKEENKTSEEVVDNGLINDSSSFETRPAGVLLTGDKRYRLTTVYKVNMDKGTGKSFIGSDNYHQNYQGEESNGSNRWHNHFMPGLEAVYGYNMINISLFDLDTKKQKLLFEKPVLIKTLYFPSFSSDTLNGKPVKRNYFLVSVYDEDTNRDGFINENDLRHLYCFSLDLAAKTPVLPLNYSAISSEYDPANDYMYVFARLDENHNGIAEDPENIHIFWIDLKDPIKNGRQY